MVKMGFQDLKVYSLQHLAAHGQKRGLLVWGMVSGGQGGPLSPSLLFRHPSKSPWPADARNSTAGFPWGKTNLGFLAVA